MRLKDKVAVITGASRGLGKALAVAFASEGALISICSKSNNIFYIADQIKSSCSRCHVGKVDVSDYNAIKEFIEEVYNRFGRIDILVNNAAILGIRTSIVDYPIEEWKRVIDVNLNGVFYVTREALRYMIPQRSGSIIMVSSSVGRTGRAKWGAYSVSKFGVEGLMQILADELKEFGIRVNSVNPGPIATEMRRQAYPDEDPTKLKRPEDIVDVFIYLASDESKDITGMQFDAQNFKLSEIRR
ncbi:NAD(P)-dependent dehydrogenase, short-chain alcohol dehydrogenase family [Candidatus Thermokryptus mobilis]|uniref:NAD(P)-dependent dehydrogenase, short-chain alcohol dehydrogenase family n=1 Tax=Candidatus Thermokryptus mobilis TaxID=1643428 RepID=A0A0S4MWJ2_9BACT|nr:SDR family NAD(P)-dependent oxidoreductase [Candidatus Thermokryptus mobilis]CUU03370.1 NAD(P)-dependent dehydrogenase, short-chain alcohol dehydrogenase family [Candidatus Thermokryptus mobilis]